MPRLKWPSAKLAHWVFVLLLALLALPLLHSLYLVRLYTAELQAREAHSVERRLDATLQSVSERTERVKAVLETLATSEAALKGDWPALYAHARRLVGDDATLRAIALVNSDLGLVFDTGLAYGGKLAPAGQPDHALRVLKTGQPALSGPFESPLKGAEPGWRVAVDVPLRSHGQVSHVLRGVLTCDSLRDVLLGTRFPPGWLASITDRDGVLIARSLDHDNTVGKGVPPAMAEVIRSHRSGSLPIVSREGTHYLAQVGFLPGGDWSVHIGVAQATLALTTQNAVRNIAVFYVLVFLAVLTVGWFVANRLGGRLGTVVSLANALTRNSPLQPVATGIRELDQLQAEFQDLSLEQQRLLADSRRSEALLQDMNLELEQRVAERTTDLVEANARIDAERQRFLKMLDTMPVIVDIIRADHRIEWANHAYREALGDNVGKRCFASQFDRETPCAECQAFVPLRTGQPHHWEWTLPTGQTYDIYNFPFVAADGTPAVLEMDIDITEQRQARAALQTLNETLEARVAERTAQLSEATARLEDSNRRFDLAMDAASEGIWDWNMETGAVYFSPGYATMLGYGPHDLAQHVSTWTGLLHPDEAEAVTREAGERLRGPGQYALEFRLRCQDGRYAWILSRGKVVARNDAGEPIRAIGTHVDITELKEARLKADAANLAKSAFLANMSHEIRTPLNGIMGLAAIIRNAGLAPRQLEQMQRLEKVSHHLLDILNAILDLAKIESGKLEISAQPFQPQALIRELESIMREEMDRKHLRLDIDLGDLPPGLLGDTVRLRQAYLNLFGNAVKFTDRGGITLKVFPVAQDATSALVRFQVDDTGVGVPAEALQRLFSDFEQADNSMTRKYGGTGLGLALVRRLARLMGGDAGATSTPGVGSQFWFTARLGITPAPTQRADQAISPEAVLDRLKTAHAGRRVLLVEDEPINRMVTELQLADAGLAVDVAEDGQEGVRMAQAQPYDLILMDMQMPHMNGLEATRVIRQTVSPEVPIIATTANTFDQDRAACLAAGMNDFLGKPFVEQELFATILRWLDR